MMISLPSNGGEFKLDDKQHSRNLGVLLSQWQSILSLPTNVTSHSKLPPDKLAAPIGLCLYWQWSILIQQALAASADFSSVSARIVTVVIKSGKALREEYATCLIWRGLNLYAIFVMWASEIKRAGRDIATTSSRSSCGGCDVFVFVSRYSRGCCCLFCAGIRVSQQQPTPTNIALDNSVSSAWLGLLSPLRLVGSLCGR